MPPLSSPTIRYAQAAGVAPKPEEGPPEKLRIAVYNLAAEGVPETVAKNLTDLVAGNLTKFGIFEVITNKDIIRMLDYEKQKQLVGCESNISCLTEIGGAMGAEYLVTGGVGKIGENYLINLQIVNIRRARVDSRQSSEPLGREGEILSSAPSLVQKLVRPLLQAREGSLVIRASEEGANVKVDDALVGTTPLERLALNWGPHTVKVEKNGFVAFAKDIHVESDRPINLEVRLIPSREFIYQYESRAGAYRTLAWTSSGLALAGLTASGVWELFARSAESDHNRKVRTLVSSGKAIVGPDGYRITDEVTRLEEQPRLDHLKNQAKTNTNISRITLGAGLLATGASLYFWLAGDPLDRYKEYKKTVEPASNAKTSFLLYLAPQRNGASLGTAWNF